MLLLPSDICLILRRSSSVPKRMPLLFKSYATDELSNAETLFLFELKRCLNVGIWFRKDSRLAATTADRCQRISASAVETLVRLHAIDWQAAGLADLGRPDGFHASVSCTRRPSSIVAVVASLAMRRI